MDMEQLERKLREQKGLTDAVSSPEAKRLAAQLNETALRDAAKRGDTGALQQMLAQVLATPEGKLLAERVKKAVEKK